MAPFSEQSSRFLQAKNLTPQCNIYELPDDAVKPIKYGESFY